MSGNRLLPRRVKKVDGSSYLNSLLYVKNKPN